MFGRRRGGAPVSLFPFQSLMIGLIGVLLVIVVLFLLRILQNAAADPAVAARKTKLAALQQEIAALRAQLAEPPPMTAPDAGETAALRRHLAAMIRRERARIAALQQSVPPLPPQQEAPDPVRALKVEAADGQPLRVADCRADGVLVQSGSEKRFFPVRDGTFVPALAGATDFLARTPGARRVVLLVRPSSANYAALWEPQLEQRLAPAAVTWEPLPSDGAEALP